MSKPAARLGDMHVCPKVEPGPVPHVGGPIISGSPNVIIGGMPAARVDDMAVCIGPPDKVSAGSATVLINGKPAARLGDSCGHGGKIVVGCPTVLIGDGRGSRGVASASSSSHLPKPPQSKEETLARMEQATKKVQASRSTQQPLPQSPYSTADKVRVVEEGLNEKFIVRVIETKYAGDDGTIGKMPQGATTATYWTTTYTQLEHADKDAELITQSVGIDYNPDAEYTLLLIDQEQANTNGDMVSLIPTYDNLTDFSQTELADEFEGREHLIEPCMTPQFSESYEQIYKTALEKDVNLDRKEDFNDLASDLGFDADQRRILQVRHQMNKRLGANEQFLGNGMTKDNNTDNPITPFGPAQEGQQFGPVETFTLDKNPQTLGKLEKAGIVTRIPLNNA